MPVTSYATYRHLSLPVDTSVSYRPRSAGSVTFNPASLDLMTLQSRSPLHGCSSTAISRYPSSSLAGARLSLLLSGRDDTTAGDDVRDYGGLHSVLERVRASSPVADYTLRHELDSFRRVVDTLPQVRGQEVKGQGHRLTTDGGRVDLGQRLSEARSDWKLVETLVGRLFDNERLDRLTPAQINNNNTKAAEEQLQWEESVGGSRWLPTDYTQSDSLADMAVQWAEERRRRVESQLSASRDEDLYRPRVTDLVQRSQHMAARSPLQLELDVMTSEPAGRDGYYRSLSATSVRPALTSSSGPVLNDRQVRSGPAISDARRRVRQVLCKSKGDPRYFDRRQRQHRDDYDSD